jgi:hypothetical protein
MRFSAGHPAEDLFLFSARFKDMQKQKKAASKPTKATKAAPPRARSRTKAKVEVVSDNDVRQKAYSLWESRGCPFGSPEVDWYRAKEQLSTGKAI